MLGDLTLALLGKHGTVIRDLLARKQDQESEQALVRVRAESHDLLPFAWILVSVAFRKAHQDLIYSCEWNLDKESP